MNKVTVAVVALLVIGFGGLVFFSMNQNADSGTDYSNYDASKIIDITSMSDKGEELTGGIAEHVRGNTDAKVTVVEYADLQCPGCASVMPKITSLYKKYGDRVAFVFRHFPISGHQNARAASAAAEAAGFQGKFWEMVETLYSNRSQWINESGSKRTAVFKSLFAEIYPEADLDKFETDLSNAAIEKKINFDYGIGRNVSGVTATPAFYVNGKAIDFDGAETVDDMGNLIETEIKKQLNEATE